MKIPLYRVFWDENDVEAVSKIIKRGMYWTGGPENELFEATLADYVGAKHGATFNSGTSALTALLLAHQIGSGDEVILPSFTYFSTANAVIFAEGVPVFADIEDETYGLSVEDVEAKITRRTKAIIAVHVYGLPCRIRELSELAEDHDLILIEDAAEALGAQVHGRLTGSFGDAIFSTAGNKIITTGEGGMAVTNSTVIRDGLFKIRRNRSWRMPSINAALGLTQFRKLELLIDMRRSNAGYLTAGLSVRGIKPPSPPNGYHHTYQFYTIRVDEGRDDLRKHLEEGGISTKIYFEPVERGLPITDKVSSHVLTLPMYPSLMVDEMKYILEMIKRFLV